jgi:hypothetical protein
MDIDSLDDDEKNIQYFYISHESWIDEKYKIVFGKSFQDEINPISKYIYTIILNDSTILGNENSIIKIPSINKFIKNSTIYSKDIEYKSFQFIINYLQQYTDNQSYNIILSKPASKTGLTSWLENPIENVLFNKFRNINNIDNESKLLIYELSIILLFANYLGMDCLINKCSFLIAYAIAGKSAEEINKIYEN